MAKFICVAPMRHVVNELKQAKFNADRILANEKASGAK